MANLVDYEDSGSDYGSPRQKNAAEFNEFSEMRRVKKEGYEDSGSDDGSTRQKNAAQVNKFSEMGRVKKENEDSVSTVMCQPFYLKPFSPNTYEASSSSTPWSSIKSSFVDMGYSSALVEKAIRIHGTDNEEAILEYVLACQAADYSSDSSDEDSIADPEGSDCDDTYDIGRIEANNQEHIASNQFPKEAQLGDSQVDDIKAQLLEMGYSESEVASAVDINGINTSIVELVDFIDAHLRGVENSEHLEAIIDNFEEEGVKVRDEETCLSKLHKKKKADIALNGSRAGSSSTNKTTIRAQQKKIRREEKIRNRLFRVQQKKILKEEKIRNRLIRAEQKKILKEQRIRDRVQSEQAELNDEHLMLLDPSLKGLIGFGVPGYPVGQRPKELKAFMHGPPFFYFENVAMAPKDVWKTISRHFGGIDPEFVDSKYFSASMRPRGYVHNLPIDGRFQVLPLPPMTIHEALPQTKKYWPPWDGRKKLNCICTARGSDILCQELRSIMRNSNGNPALPDQAYILENCKKWNLVWVGPDQMAPLEPNEIELILGFDKDHSRGASARIDRLQCLGNAFQIDTIAYHLSALKPFYPDGLTVLSLFSGIGGAEVALHRIGIHLKCVVSVEICPKKQAYPW